MARIEPDRESRTRAEAIGTIVMLLPRFPDAYLSALASEMRQHFDEQTYPRLSLVQADPRRDKLAASGGG